MSYRASTPEVFAIASVLLAALGCGNTVDVRDPATGGTGGEQGGAGGIAEGTGATGGIPADAPPPAYWCSPNYDDTTTPEPEECCQVMVCGPRVDGICPLPDEVEPETLANFPPGPEGGSCACADLIGPFASDPGAPASEDCCYAMGAVPCSG